MDSKDLLEIYKTFQDRLCNRIFRYVYTNRTTQEDEIVDIRFFTENFCHLIGIQHIYGGNQYRGKDGLTRIESGEITFDSMKRHNRNAYNQCKIRFMNFDKIEELLYNATLLRFYPERVSPRTKICADFVVMRNEKPYFLHLFLVREKNRNIYVPRSFVVTSENDKNAKRLFVGQEIKRIKSFEVVPCKE